MANPNIIIKTVGIIKPININQDKYYFDDIISISPEEYLTNYLANINLEESVRVLLLKKYVHHPLDFIVEMIEFEILGVKHIDPKDDINYKKWTHAKLSAKINYAAKHNVNLIQLPVWGKELQDRGAGSRPLEGDL